jgi:hypothetical protein
MNKIELFPGIWKFENVFDKSFDIVNKIEESALKGEFSWSKASVGLEQINTDYRDCYDFKLSDLGKDHEIYKYIYESQKPYVDAYSDYYQIQMDFWEWTNVVKYGPGQYFKEHADHGWSYVSTVSLVSYPNEDYLGGELAFPKLKIFEKPKAGDLYIFPSTYLFSHVAMPVRSGTKYSFVTMLDYNDDTHTVEYEEYIDRKYGKK